MWMTSKVTQCHPFIERNVGTYLKKTSWRWQPPSVPDMERKELQRYCLWDRSQWTEAASMGRPAKYESNVPLLRIKWQLKEWNEVLDKASTTSSNEVVLLVIKVHSASLHAPRKWIYGSEIASRFTVRAFDDSISTIKESVWCLHAHTHTHKQRKGDISPSALWVGKGNDGWR